MKKILFIGDSITEWNPISHTYLENIGKAGATSDDIIKILEKTEGTFEKAFILCGINDINNNISLEKIYANYLEILEITKKLANKIYVISTLPTQVAFVNTFVKELNERVKNIKEIKFIDIYKEFLDKDNLLNKNLSIDSVHLNDKGYILLNSYVVKKFFQYDKMNSVKERFLEYTRWHTTSTSKNKNTPSTIGQHIFAYFLKEELINIGMKEVEVDKYSYVTATLPSNTDKNLKTLAFIAHMDTAPDMSGKDVKAKIWKDYDGKDIILNENTILSPKDFPELKNYMGKEIITGDGNTLLGCDDKGGIAQIITALDYLIKNPSIEHGTIKVAFTPDEEVGSGCKNFDLKKFNADFAYTIDGGQLGELEFENFNACNFELNIKGRNVHPGSAKNKMIHASLIAIEFESLLPSQEKPQFTEGYEGFIALTGFIGHIEEAKVNYILRDHSKEKFEFKKDLVKKAVNYLEEKYPKAKFELKMNDSYYNMKEKIEPCMFLIDIAKKAMEAKGIKPLIKPVRGGTDGARLSYMGLPCPNIFTGGHNFHGKYEYVVKESMELGVEVIIEIIKNFAKLNFN